MKERTVGGRNFPVSGKGSAPYAKVEDFHDDEAEADVYAYEFYGEVCGET